MLVFLLCVGAVLMCQGFVTTGAIICVFSAFAIIDASKNGCDSDDEDW